MWTTVAVLAAGVGQGPEVAPPPRVVVGWDTAALQLDALYRAAVGRPATPAEHRRARARHGPRLTAADLEAIRDELATTPEFRAAREAVRPAVAPRPPVARWAAPAPAVRFDDFSSPFSAAGPGGGWKGGAGCACCSGFAFSGGFTGPLPAPAPARPFVPDPPKPHPFVPWLAPDVPAAAQLPRTIVPADRFPPKGVLPAGAPGFRDPPKP